MSLALRVFDGEAWEDVTSKLLTNTFSLDAAIGQRDTLRFTLKSEDASYCPGKGAPVEVIHSELGKMFGGTIRKANSIQRGKTEFWHVCGCASWEQIFDRRPVGKRAFTDTPADQVFLTLFTEYLGAEILTATAVESGPNITIAFDFCTVREAFDRICEAASSDTDTYMWDCTPGRVTRFYSQASYHAPFDITEAQSNVRLSGLDISYDFAEYCNKVFGRVSQFVGDERTQMFHGDGTTQSFPCELPLAAAPTITRYDVAPDVATLPVSFTTDGSFDYPLPKKPAYIGAILVDGVDDGGRFTWTVGNFLLTDTAPASGETITFSLDYYTGTTTEVGTAQTVGIRDVDTGKQWYWKSNENEVTQDVGDTPLAAGTALKVVYSGYESTVIDGGQNDAEVLARSLVEGCSGYYMKVIDIDKPGIRMADAQAYLTAYLAKYSRIGRIVEYSTAYGGFKKGQWQQIALSRSGDTFDETFLVESVSITNQSGTDWTWKVRAVSGALGNRWLMKLKRMTEKGSGSGSASASVIAESQSVTVNGAVVAY